MSEEWLNNQPPRVREVIVTANDLIEHGCRVHFKFTCEKCGNRCAFEEKNTFHESGVCDRCGHETDTRLSTANLNYLVIAEGAEAADYLAKKMTERVSKS